MKRKNEYSDAKAREQASDGSQKGKGQGLRPARFLGLRCGR